MLKNAAKRLSIMSLQTRAMSTHLKAFATVDPENLSVKDKCQNLVGGEWVDTRETIEMVDPLTGKPMITLPNTQLDEIQPFVDGMRACPKYGLHNPFLNKERYLMLGEVNRKLCEVMHDPEVFNYICRLSQRQIPKSDQQTRAEISVTVDFFENFCGDQVRFLARGFNNPGDHAGQSTSGFRWPFGPVGVISPFNFPIEIPVLQFMGALYMGNRPTVKPDMRCSAVLEQWIRMLHYCGLPKEDMDLIHCDGPVMEKILVQGKARVTQFTGSTKVGEHLVKKLDGRVRLEDGGFDWKILGHDIPKNQADIDFVAYMCDNDAYNHSGQKCSAQSIMFMHRNWKKTDVIEKMAVQAGKRNLKNLTCGPVISWSNEAIIAHMNAVLELEGAKILFGGNPLKNHSIPKQYGAFEPTAVFVPLKHFRSAKKFKLLTTELFGPFQIVTEFTEGQTERVLEILEEQEAHLTAGIVSNDPIFTEEVLGRTVNGVTYSGLKARTTGAPQNHWFGPSGDPRGAGIGTPEAIQLTWSHHREIIRDIGPVAKDWTIPDPV